MMVTASETKERQGWSQTGFGFSRFSGGYTFQWAIRQPVAGAGQPIKLVRLALFQN